MNKIEQELAKAVTQSRKDIPVIQECYSILEKHCIDFNRWCFDNYCYDYDLNQWREYSEEWVPHTTEQLFELYIKSL